MLIGRGALPKMNRVNTFAYLSRAKNFGKSSNKIAKGNKSINLISYPTCNFSFSAITRNYLSRRAMLNMMLETNKKEAYAKLPIMTKFIQAFTHKKRRFAYLVILALLYYYDCWNRTRNWFINKRYRVIRKYENRWIYKYSPDKRVYVTAVETLRTPNKISQENFNKLGATFIQVENQLLYGVSRQLIINVLTKLERMDGKMAAKFLRDSGYNRARARTLHSCDLLELCELLETISERIKNDKTEQENQDELIDSFITLLPKEVKNFEDNIESVIAEMERKGQEIKESGSLFG